MATFSVWDYVVFSIMLIVSAGIGVYFRLTGGKQKTTKEYLLADNDMSILPVSASLMASFMSAITLLGVSTENYQYGMIFIVINFSYGLATPIAAYLYLPVFFKLQAASVYEYLELRFGKIARLCASIAFSIQMILYMGIVLYAPALALETVTGISKEIAIFAIGLVCTFYSTIGGMKAVLITDLFQTILMFSAVYCIIICAAIKAGGISPIWNTAVEGGRINFLNFSFDPVERHTWWSLIIGGGFTYLSLYAVNQAQVQRLLTLKSLKKSQLALWMNWPILTFLSISTSFCGLAIYYNYRTCDPFLQKRISNRDQLMPIFVLDELSQIPGISGLFVSGIFSACLSTVSSAVNSLAAVTIEDYIKPLYKFIKKHPMEDMKSTLPTKIIAFTYGIVCIGIAFLAQSLAGVLQASLTIFGVVGGPLFALFTLGMFTTTANEKGSISGLLIGLGISLWFGFGNPRPPPVMLDFSLENCTEFEHYSSITPHNLLSKLNITTMTASLRSDEYLYVYRISYLWYIVIAFLITMISGYIISYLLEKFNFAGESKIYTDHTKSFINTNLFSPPFAKRLKKQMAQKFTNTDSFLNGSFKANSIDTYL